MESSTLYGNSRRATALIALIKSVHTLIFAGMGACVLRVFYSGITGRVSRLTWVSLTAVIGEGLVFIGNGWRCPLTNMAEARGSSNATVGDIFLPGWFARRIPVVSSTMVVVGLAGMGLHRLASTRGK